MNKLKILTFSIGLFFAGTCFAKTDLSITTKDISFSEEGFFNEQTVRIFARVSNIGDTDVRGFVVFFNNGKQILDPQPISVRYGSYDDVFIDWKFKTGDNSIEAKIIDTNLTDEDLANNKTGKRTFYVDIDTDNDGIGNLEDADDDNDGVQDTEEVKNKTNPLVADTDGDGYKDDVDVFPLNKSEWKDTNQNGVGDNTDPDIDGDGLSNVEEKKLGTDPYLIDTDEDGLADKSEIILKTDPIKIDTDGDGSNDNVDDFPLDPTKGQAGLMGALEGKGYILWILGVLSVIIIFIWFKRRKKHE